MSSKQAPYQQDLTTTPTVESNSRPESRAEEGISGRLIDNHEVERGETDTILRMMEPPGLGIEMPFQTKLFLIRQQSTET